MFRGTMRDGGDDAGECWNGVTDLLEATSSAILT
jgi:hypothetical protein